MLKASAALSETSAAEAGPSIFRNRNFLLLWGAALLSSFGISFFLFTQSWYVVHVLGLEASLGVLYTAASIPRLVFMIVSGTVADRFSRTKLMFLSDFTRGVLLTGLVFWFLFGDISLWTFVGFAFAFGILDAFFWAAEGAVLPSIISRDQLTRGNSIIQMTNQTSFILAPMAAGVIISLSSYALVFTVTAVMLFTGSLFIYLMKVQEEKETEGEEEAFWDAFKEGVRYVRNSRVLTLIIGMSILLNLFMVGPMTMGLPLFVKQRLNGTALDFSFLEAGLAGGMLLGAVLLGILNLKKRRGRTSLLALVFAGGAFFALSFTEELWLSLGCLVVFGFFLSVCNIPVLSVLQSFIEDKMMGRVMGLVSLASMGLVPVSYALTSVILAAGVPIHQIMAWGSVLVTLYVLFVYLRFKELRELD
ncbi:MFS transporter [Halobacillus litoralis]|uniref:MFS transporter n=1 Tax=Halobacillus litoralis TaxID=45668 RepID=A0A845DT00_9BACI|nr:MFS transporter [Halobacillus litoralis]MYL20536.1 MFS transporter [Halobacillus litoralis]